ncbi:MAG: hypothetical protein ABWZ52_10295 [Acidimicrobiales bacterium]
MATHARLLAALLAGATVVAAGCGETTDQGSAAEAELADAEVVATTLEVVATDHHFTMSATTVAEGMVPVELVNDGESPHHLLVVRLDDGQTMDDYLAAFDGGEGAANELVTHAGGVNAVEPGSSAVGYADLAPGTYLVLCFIPGAEGEAHLTDGMVAELEVVPADPVPSPTTTVGEISLVDFGFGLPESGLSAAGTYRLTNEGESDHELSIMRVDDGKALGDVVTYLQAGFQGEPPVAFTGGAGGIEPGEDGYIDLDLAPGTYLVMCFLGDEATGKRHVELGMLSQLTVP